MRLNVYEKDLPLGALVVERANEDGFFTGLRFPIPGNGPVTHTGADGQAANAVTFYHRKPKRLLALMQNAVVKLQRHIARTEKAEAKAKAAAAPRRKPGPKPGTKRSAAPAGASKRRKAAR